MPRPKGSKNRKTIAREVVAAIESGRRVDSLDFMERALTFYDEQISRENVNKERPNLEKIELWFTKGVEIAMKIAKFRHPQLSMTKVIGDPTKTPQVDLSATKEQLREKIFSDLRDLGMLPGPAIEVEASPPAEGVAPRGNGARGNGANSG